MRVAIGGFELVFYRGTHLVVNECSIRSAVDAEGMEHHVSPETLRLMERFVNRL